MNHLNRRTLGRCNSPCPRCKRRTTERIDDGRALNKTVYVLFGLLTCGLGFAFYPLFTRPKYALYCDKCDRSFAE